MLYIRYAKGKEEEFLHMDLEAPLLMYQKLRAHGLLTPYKYSLILLSFFLERVQFL